MKNTITTSHSAIPDGYAQWREEIVKFPVKEIREIPIGQVWLDQLGNIEGEFGQVPLDQISWYHHISLLAKVKSVAERAFYIAETAATAGAAT